MRTLSLVWILFSSGCSAPGLCTEGSYPNCALGSFATPPVLATNTCASGVTCSDTCCAAGFQSRARCDNQNRCALDCFTGGYADCDGDPENGCETQTSSDSQNCGVCGVLCPTGTRCSGSYCR